MKSRVLFCVSVMVCLSVLIVWADDKKMTKVNKPAPQRVVNNQAGLPKNAQPGAPKNTSGVPDNSTSFSGHQNGYTPVQTGGGQNQEPQTSESPDLPQGGPAWLKKDGKNSGKGGVDQFSRDAQITQLADPNAGFKELSGKDPGTGNNLSDEPMGANGVTGGSATPAFLPTTVDRGAGKNTSSTQDQQSEGGSPGRKFDSWDNQAMQPVHDVEGNYMGTKGALTHDDFNQKWGGVSRTDRAAYIKNNEDFQKAFVKDKEEAEKMRVQQEKEMDKQAGNSPRTPFSGPVKGDYTPPTSGGDQVTTSNPDSVDDSHVPDSVRRLSSFGQIDPKDVEAEHNRQVTMPGEGAHTSTIGRNDVQVTKKDVLAKITDNRIQPVEGDGTTTNLGGGTNPDVNIDPVTGQPTPGKSHGGGGDPADPKHD